LNDGAIGLLDSQDAILSGLAPEARACAPDQPEPTVAEPAGVGIYTCEFTEPEASPSPTPSAAASSAEVAAKAPLPKSLPDRAKIQSLFGRIPGSLIFDASSGNDNYPGRTSQRSEHDTAFDFGHTFDLKLSTVKVLGRDSKLGKRGDALGIEVGTELYSQPVASDWSTYHGLIQAQAVQNQTGVPVELKSADGRTRSMYLDNIRAVVPMGKGKFRQESLARNYATLFKEWNREKFTIIGEVTVEKRDTDGKNFANQFQNGWHRAGGAEYTYQDENAQGRSGTVTTQTTGHANTVDVVDVSVGPDVPTNPAILEYGSWATSVGTTIRKTKRVFRGTCELQTSLDARLGVQGDAGKITFDRNSRIQLGSMLGTRLIRNRKWDDAKLSLKGGTAIVYFPRATSAGNFGWNAESELQGNFHAGKSGNVFQTAIQFTARGLAGTFQDIDDKDSIFKLSLRYVLVGKRRK
jgi:hypothetical protein